MTRPTPPPTASASSLDPVDFLVRAGRHEDAAALAEAEGDLARALALYEKVWRFDKAWPLAEALADWPRAVRLALEARAPAEAERIADRLVGAEASTLVRVAEAFAGRGHFERAATLAQEAGDLARAADLYRRAGLPIAAARALATAGRLRDAVRMLENVIATSDPAAGLPNARERARAELAMGKLMSRLGRPWEAARALQSAARHEDTRADAHRHLCGVLLELGLRHAGDEVARRLRREHPEAPRGALEVAATLPADAREVPERFAVERLLGAGAMGRVYLATDRLFDRPVALKALSVGASGAEEQALARFLREAEAAGRLHHPHIVALYDVDLSAGLLVFEYLAGGSLAQELALGEPLPLARVRRLGLELLEALAAAHDAGIVHRDVKPANVFVDAAGGAKLGDFGAAHLLDFGQTQTGGLIGTLAYLSPEQVTGDRIGPRADLYGLAATLFEALTGRPPFLGPDFVSQHLADPPPRPSALRPDLTALAAEAVDEALLRALSKAPEDRFESTRAMAEALRAWPVDVALDARRPRAPAPCEAEALAPVPVYTPRERLGVTCDADGRETGVLMRAHDGRVDRVVVEWRPYEPLGPAALAAWRHAAALGGPHVQRVLGLAEGARDLGHVVIFESLDGEVSAVAGASVPPVVVPALARLEALWPGFLAEARVVHTAAGPVLLVQPLAL
ncbi:MAG: serine/threonine protein kinase [Myxococcales bacterium]|nr:serine/threonine protein kinase [Myxococcales bacterium]